MLAALTSAVLLQVSPVQDAQDEDAAIRDAMEAEQRQFEQTIQLQRAIEAPQRGHEGRAVEQAAPLEGGVGVGLTASRNRVAHERQLPPGFEHVRLPNGTLAAAYREEARCLAEVCSTFIVNADTGEVAAIDGEWAPGYLQTRRASEVVRIANPTRESGERQ